MANNPIEAVGGNPLLKVEARIEQASSVQTNNLNNYLKPNVAGKAYEATGARHATQTASLGEFSGGARYAFITNYNSESRFSHDATGQMTGNYKENADGVLELIPRGQNLELFA